MEDTEPDADSEWEKSGAYDEVKHCLRSLTANLIRVTRGAGKSYELTSQVFELADALTKYRAVFGCGVSSDVLNRMLNGPVTPRLNGNDEYGRKSAEHLVIRGALQIVASRLLGQRTQESAGEGELLDGVNAVIAHRQKRK